MTKRQNCNPAFFYKSEAVSDKAFKGLIYGCGHKILRADLLK